MLTIPLPLPTFNQVVAASKHHWAKYLHLKGSATSKVETLARQQRRSLPPITRPCCFTFAWYPADRRTDLDNMAAGGTKVILDGLVVAKILPQDTQRYVRRLDQLLMNPDPENPRVVVSWCEVFI